MNRTKLKFKSKSGSSMIIALLFMLICVFIGGAVLTAATVNGGRIAGKYEQQQAILNQRSIISVFAASLANTDGKIDLTTTFVSDASGNPCINSNDAVGIKRAIFRAADNAYQTGLDATVEFSVKTPDGNISECYVKCKAGSYKTTITFKDNPQLMLEMYARSPGNSVTAGSSTIHWYGGKIVKAVQ